MHIVVTGMGVVSPIGTGIDQFWNSAISGKSGISGIQCFDASGLRSRIAGQITGFDPAIFLTAKQLEQTDRFTQLALCAADQALADAGKLESYEPRGVWL